MTDKLIVFIAKCCRHLELTKHVKPGMFRWCGRSKYISLEEAFDHVHSICEDKGGSCIRKTKATISHDYDLHIIVPAYNVEKYLRGCMDSILGQPTKYSILVTLIDDGSRDSTPAIADEYASDERVEVIHQENRGFSGARNRGLENIRGSYVMFVDSDDKLESGAIDKLLDKAFSENLDMVAGSIVNVDNNDRNIGEYILGSEKEDKYLCAKVFRARLFETIQLPEGYWFEDTILRMVMFSLTSAYANISDVIYRYLDNYSGISRTYGGNAKALDSLYVTLHLHADRHKLGIKDTSEYYHSLLYQCPINYVRISSLQNNRLDRCVFKIMSDLIWKMSFQATKPQYKLMEWALKNENYKAYLFAANA